MVAWLLVEQETHFLGPGEFDERFVEVLPVGLLDDQFLPRSPVDAIGSIQIEQIFVAVQRLSDETYAKRKCLFEIHHIGVV
jgi:hypothetical protein